MEMSVCSNKLCISVTFLLQWVKGSLKQFFSNCLDIDGISHRMLTHKNFMSAQYIKRARNNETLPSSQAMAFPLNSYSMWPCLCTTWTEWVSANLSDAVFLITLAMEALKWSLHNEFESSTVCAVTAVYFLHTPATHHVSATRRRHCCTNTLLWDNPSVSHLWPLLLHYC